MPNTIYNPLTGNFDYVIDDAAEIAYAPADPADWPVAPDDTKEALDSLANTVASLSVGAAPDATTTTKGIVKLAGDLSGTADLPTVPEMFKKDGTVAATGDFNLNNKKITNLANPTTSFDATNKSYVDSSVTSILSAIPVERVALATVPGDLPSYVYYPGPNPFDSGVGATVVIPSPLSPVTIDGHEIQVGDLVLLKDLADYTHNGVYQVYSIGGFGLDAQLTRHTSFDNSPEIPGSKVSVIKGSQNVGKLFVARASFAFGIASQFQIGIDPINYFEPNGNTASNVGGGNGIFKQKSGADLQFKSLQAGTNITLTSTTDSITINSSGGGASSGLTAFELLANAKMLQGEYGFSSDAKEAFTQATLKMDIVSDRLVFWTSSHFYPIVSNTTPRYVFFGSSSINASKPVIVGSNVFFKNRVISSTNFLSVNVATPSNWSTSSIPGSPFVGVASSGTTAVAILTSTASYYTSSDGVTWTLRSYNVAPSPANPSRVHFANNLFFITQGNSSAHLTSPDGLTWTARASGVGINCRDIVWGSTPGIYVSISDAQILTSPDGITWTVRTNPLSTATCISLTYSTTNRFLILTTSGIIQSNDGVTWTIVNYCNGLSLNTTTCSLAQTSTGTIFLSVGRDLYSLTNLGARIVPYQLDSFASIKQVTTGVVVSGNAQVYFLGKQTSPQIYGMPILNYRPMNDTYYSSTLLSNTSFSTSPIPMSFFDSATVDISGYSVPGNNPTFASAAVMGNNLIFYPEATNSFYSTTSTATLECIEGNALPWIPNNPSKPFVLIAVSSDPTDSIIWYQYSSNGVGVTTSQISNGITGAFKAIAVTNNTFIAVGSSGVSMKYTHSTTSLPDVAANWSSANLSSVSTANFTKLVAGNGVFIAIVQELGTNANPIYVSSDLGNSWSAVTLSAFDDNVSTLITVFFLKGKFYALGKNGNFTNGTFSICLSSLDGINWTNETSEITDIILENTGSTSDIQGLRFKKVAGRYYSVGCDRNYILPVFEE